MNNFSRRKFLGVAASTPFIAGAFTNEAPAVVMPTALPPKNMRIFYKPKDQWFAKASALIRLHIDLYYGSTYWALYQLAGIDGKNPNASENPLGHLFANFEEKLTGRWYHDYGDVLNIDKRRPYNLIGLALNNDNITEAVVLLQLNNDLDSVGTDCDAYYGYTYSSPMRLLIGPESQGKNMAYIPWDVWPLTTQYEKFMHDMSVRHASITTIGSYFDTQSVINMQRIHWSDTVAIRDEFKPCTPYLKEGSNEIYYS